ncbi:LysR family transcriptional regulator [Mesorhizobium sp. BR1-1-16]|uniref:LysR family transcriptional regulator n=1 Tax=Mesorhizobium sp. BR1-1-16 TaxID=2876653 RepID=UPI001CCA3289|nr:LysR family transcriptional regulator [Mesorhizobium sp. BR1-1-16]MBZ9937003.1 LysR family transcriptional regulator [Mesorhizobium sp. BR1-1-16]
MLQFDIKHLKFLIAAADHGSFRKAAAALKVQESAISRRIRDIEDQIGASLFLRRPDGISLTLAGQRFLHRVRQALAHLREGAHEVATIGRAEHGHIKVGLFSTLASGFLSALFRRYDEEHAGVHVDFVEGEATDHAKAIRELDLDVAFVIGNSVWPECDAALLWSERIFAALPEDHDLAGEAELIWDQLADQDFIVRDTGPGRQIKDYIVRRVHEIDADADVEIQRVGRSNILNLVALGRGITLVSESESAIIVPRVAYRPVHGEWVPFSAVWNPRNDNPAFRTLLSLARSMARPAGVAGGPPP